MKIHDESSVSWLGVPCRGQATIFIDHFHVQKWKSVIFLLLPGKSQVGMEAIDLLQCSIRLLKSNVSEDVIHIPCVQSSITLYLMVELAHLAISQMWSR